MLNLLKAILSFIDARMGEPSTYASLSVILASAGFNVSDGVMHTVAMYGMVAAGALGVLLSESNIKPGVQVAEDVAKAAVAGIKAMPVTTAGLAIVAMASLSACSAQQGVAVLTAAGVSQAQATTIVSDSAAAGQLFCQSESGVVAVAGANVVGATGQAVANVCAVATAAGALTPVAPPAGTVATVVAVAPIVIAALEASKAAIVVPAK